MTEQISNQEDSHKRLAFMYELASGRSEGSGEPLQFPINIAGNDLIVSYFGKDKENLRFGLYLGEQRYARKSIEISSNGSVVEDTRGAVLSSPLQAFDLTENEPDFSNVTNEEIALAVFTELMKKLNIEPAQ